MRGQAPRGYGRSTRTADRLGMRHPVDARAATELVGAVPPSSRSRRGRRRGARDRAARPENSEEERLPGRPSPTQRALMSTGMPGDTRRPRGEWLGLHVNAPAVMTLTRRACANHPPNAVSVSEPQTLSSALPACLPQSCIWAKTCRRRGTRCSRTRLQVAIVVRGGDSFRARSPSTGNWPSGRIEIVQVLAGKRVS